MFHRSSTRKLKRAITLAFFSYCVVYLVNLISRSPDNIQGVPGPDSLCPTDFPNVEHGRQNIFFLETSGETCLSARQACSIESAARANPYATIAVHMESSGRLLRGKKLLVGQQRRCALTDSLFERHPNVKLMRENLIDHLRETPLWRLHEKGLLNQSTHPLTHRSDAVRVALLWKEGGLYLDLDCIVLRPLHCLENTVGLIDFLPDWVENGVMAFQARHPFVEFLMKYMVFAYKPDEYISLGPSTLTDAIKYFCDRDDLPALEQMTCRNSSRSIILQPPSAFYAINNKRQNAFYHLEADPLDWTELKYSYLTHVYDAGKGRQVSEMSFYALLARKYCPSTWQAAVDEGEF